MTQPGFLDLLSFGPDGWAKALLAGAWMTILIALSGYTIGAVIGTFGAWAKISGGTAVRVAADAYTTILRGIPDLLVIYLLYFGGSAAITSIGRLFGAEGFIGFPGFLAGALAVGITSGAQHTEVFRGAFKAVHRGEIEAAIACGMSRSLRFRRIIAPLTLRHALPGLGNVWQVVLKESALVSITGVVELLRQSQIGAGSTGLPFDFYLIAGLIYLAISTVSSVAMRAGRTPLQPWREEGLMDWTFTQETFVSLISALPLTLSACWHVDPSRCRAGTGAGARPDFAAFARSNWFARRLCLRLSRHAAARADFPDLLRAQPVSGRSGTAFSGLSCANPTGARSWL